MANDGNGRNKDGTFARGNSGGPGNPHARRVGQIRSKMLAAITDDDLDAIVRALIEKARAGEAWAVKEVLSRLIGETRLSEPDPLPTIDELMNEFHA